MDCSTVLLLCAASSTALALVPGPTAGARARGASLATLAWLAVYLVSAPPAESQSSKAIDGWGARLSLARPLLWLCLVPAAWLALTEAAVPMLSQCSTACPPSPETHAAPTGSARMGAKCPPIVAAAITAVIAACCHMAALLRQLGLGLGLLTQWLPQPAAQLAGSVPACCTAAVLASLLAAEQGPCPLAYGAATAGLFALANAAWLLDGLAQSAAVHARQHSWRTLACVRCIQVAGLLLLLLLPVGWALDRMGPGWSRWAELAQQFTMLCGAVPLIPGVAEGCLGGHDGSSEGLAHGAHGAAGAARRGSRHSLEATFQGLQQRAVVMELQEEVQRKGQLLAVLSNELRTPLTAIMQLTAAIARGAGGTLHERGRAWVETVHDCAIALLAVVADATREAALTRSMSGSSAITGCDNSGSQARSSLDIRHALVNPRSVVDRVVRMVMPLARRSVTIEKVVAQRLPPLLGDERRLAQVLSNLVHNSLKLTEQGKVCIMVYTDEPGHQIIFKVTDTGCGIDATSPTLNPTLKAMLAAGSVRAGAGSAAHSRATSRNASMDVVQLPPPCSWGMHQGQDYQPRSSGSFSYDASQHMQYSHQQPTALGGLAIAKRWVEMHGGNITAQSAGRGCGATFRVALPVLGCNPVHMPRDVMVDFRAAYTAAGYNADHLIAHWRQQQQQQQQQQRRNSQVYGPPRTDRASASSCSSMPMASAHQSASSPLGAYAGSRTSSTHGITGLGMHALSAGSNVLGAAAAGLAPPAAHQPSPMSSRPCSTNTGIASGPNALPPAPRASPPGGAPLTGLRLAHAQQQYRPSGAQYNARLSNASSILPPPSMASEARNSYRWSEDSEFRAWADRWERDEQGLPPIHEPTGTAGNSSAGTQQPPPLQQQQQQHKKQQGGAPAGVCDEDAAHASHVEEEGYRYSEDTEFQAWAARWMAKEAAGGAAGPDANGAGGAAPAAAAAAAAPVTRADTTAAAAAAAGMHTQVTAQALASAMSAGAPTYSPMSYALETSGTSPRASASSWRGAGTAGPVQGAGGGGGSSHPCTPSICAPAQHMRSSDHQLKPVPESAGPAPSSAAPQQQQGVAARVQSVPKMQPNPSWRANRASGGGASSPSAAAMNRGTSNVTAGSSSMYTATNTGTACSGGSSSDTSSNEQLHTRSATGPVATKRGASSGSSKPAARTGASSATGGSAITLQQYVNAQYSGSGPRMSWEAHGGEDCDDHGGGAAPRMSWEPAQSDDHSTATGTHSQHLAMLHAVGCMGSVASTASGSSQRPSPGGSSVAGWFRRQADMAVRVAPSKHAPAAAAPGQLLPHAQSMPSPQAPPPPPQQQQGASNTPSWLVKINTRAFSLRKQKPQE